jgi:peptide/nickel transport system substrate-binding protein
MYATLSKMVHDDGGLICPMFNDFVEAVGEKVQGWEKNGVQEVMNGLAPHKTWLA